LVLCLKDASEVSFFVVSVLSGTVVSAKATIAELCIVKTVESGIFVVSVFGMESLLGIESVWAKTTEPIKDRSSEKAIVFVFILG